MFKQTNQKGGIGYYHMNIIINALLINILIIIIHHEGIKLVCHITQCMTEKDGIEVKHNLSIYVPLPNQKPLLNIRIFSLLLNAFLIP